MGTGEFNAGGNPAMDWHPIQGGVEILLFASCYRNRDKLRPGGPQLARMQTLSLPYHNNYWRAAHVAGECSKTERNDGKG